MKTILIGLAAMTLAPAALRAQPMKATPPAPKPNLTAMYEDVEVMRRLLSRELLARQRPDAPRQPLATFRNTTADDRAVARGIAWLNKVQGGTDDANTATALAQLALMGDDVNLADAHSANILFRNISSGRAASVTPFEGAYLKGHGVVYTATISASEAVVLNTPQKSLSLLAWCSRCHDQAAVKPLVEPSADAPPQPLSDWDRTQKEVRGGPEPTSPPVRVRVQDICPPGNITEIVLKALAENGHNFRLLPANEHIIVAITVGGVRPTGGTSSGTAAAPTAGAIEALTREVRELTALADLHLKQNQNEAAQVPLSKAISRCEETTLEFPPDAPQGEVNRQVEELNRTLRGLYVRYAQALLSAGKLVQARATLDKADQARVRVKVATSAAKSPVVPGSPAKLIITVSKQAMDDVHAGKIDATKFHALAEVETINFPPPDKKK
jgi:hypothetical protein